MMASSTATRLNDILEGASSCMSADNKEEPSPRLAKPTPEASRAAAEARARRAESVAPEPRAKEIDGRKGPEPVRYGDWENKGITSDF